jgi:hypothetical protein
MEIFSESCNFLLFHDGFKQNFLPRCGMKPICTPCLGIVRLKGCKSIKVPRKLAKKLTKTYLAGCTDGWHTRDNQTQMPLPSNNRKQAVLRFGLRVHPFHPACSDNKWRLSGDGLLGLAGKKG